MFESCNFAVAPSHLPALGGISLVKETSAIPLKLFNPFPDVPDYSVARTAQTLLFFRKLMVYPALAHFVRFAFEHAPK